MRLRRTVTCVPLLLATAALGACGSSSSSAGESTPAKLTKVGGQQRITLTPQASRRVGLRTVAAQTQRHGGRTLTVIPYSALEYEANGTPYAYVQVGPLAFSRRTLTLDHVDASNAFVTAGVPAGTQVVDVGADELRGVEIGVAEEG
jgi:hypothetical protein